MKSIITILSLMIVLGFMGLMLVSVTGCGEDGLIDPHGDVELQLAPRDGFEAVNLPTNSGSAWTYTIVETGEEFTLRIEGTRDIGGVTHRQMTVSEIRPAPPDGINRVALDHLSANALYFRIESDFFEFPLPIFSTYFLKTTDGYIESAFDTFIGFLDNPIFHQKHFPPRQIWDFPLTAGKEWTVLHKTIPPETRVIRRVVEAGTPVSVPAGTYSAFVIEEEIVGVEGVEPSQQGDDPPPFIAPAKYWLVQGVGVVKYQ